jgi:hypothetical protein
MVTSLHLVENEKTQVLTITVRITAIHSCTVSIRLSEFRCQHSNMVNFLLMFVTRIQELAINVVVYHSSRQTSLAVSYYKYLGGAAPLVSNILMYLIVNLINRY